MANLRPSCREDFEIAIICALALEFNAVCLIFDEFWDDNGDSYGRAPGDDNTYMTGRIGKHNVVLILSQMGKVNSASASSGIRSSYTNVQLALLVGICGGVPLIGSDLDVEVILGDVIISKHIVQYDFGRQYPDGFIRKDTVEHNLRKPTKNIRNLVAVLETDRGQERLEARTAHFLGQIKPRQKDGNKYKYPGTTADKLFKPDYPHKHNVSPLCICRDCKSGSDPVCAAALTSSCNDLGCDSSYLIPRKRLAEKQLLEQNGPNGARTNVQAPSIHVGAIASGDTVMKSGMDRDRIAESEGVIAFEMEGAGIWEEVPCIVVKGVCDYADSHKNKRWQSFAAATAAAASKALLERYIRVDTARSASMDATPSVKQHGSRFDAVVAGTDVRQGNEIRLSSPQPWQYDQGGSDFGGNIQGHTTFQGNRIAM